MSHILTEERNVKKPEATLTGLGLDSILGI
jgi:hypothetical protein